MSESSAVDRAARSWHFQPGRGWAGRVTLFAEPGVEGESDDVAVGEVGVGIAAADPVLELKDFGDHVVELASPGVPVSDDVQSERMWRKNVIGRLEVGVERIGDFVQSAGVAGVIGHVSRSRAVGTGG